LAPDENQRVYFKHAVNTVWAPNKLYRYSPILADLPLEGPSEPITSQTLFNLSFADRFIHQVFFLALEEFLSAQTQNVLLIWLLLKDRLNTRKSFTDKNWNCDAKLFLCFVLTKYG
jgi:hypothetical protein